MVRLAPLLTVAFAAAFCLLGCVIEPNPSPVNDFPSSAAGFDVGSPPPAHDAGAQFEQPLDTSGGPSAADSAPADALTGGFGAPCLTGDDCQSGYCIETPDGHVCTEPCVDTCPVKFQCEPVFPAGADPLFLCTPAPAVPGPDVVQPDATARP